MAESDLRASLCLITELDLNGTVCSLEIRIGRLPRLPILFTRCKLYIRAMMYLCDLITLWQLTGNPINEYGMKFTYTSCIYCKDNHQVAVYLLF